MIVASCMHDSPSQGKKSNPDPGGVLHASVDAAWRSSWARHSDVPILAECIQLGLLVSPLFFDFFWVTGGLSFLFSHNFATVLWNDLLS